ncbi:SusC/RagA family TonB-linked outer membrane protein [Mucilaginibacter celer]|uniref:SusC/RagA family TonB-linked outer membrane protein n=1 Tax=Mucilaginibacter celer TaxID=2305508 RepID=A0A494VKE7_9SPHI|nr:TonB-dependent receptor [Mucilaginibacter celer]AYL94419.1 SusC/RagA family TonB-linked outer membrane protein [Mucilaginibacter celer]
MRKIILFLLVIITMLPVLVYGQGRLITGTVRDAGGVLPGATITEKGVAGNGAIADTKGRFRLALKGSSNIVIVKFVGYQTQEVHIGNKTDMDVTLASNSQGLDEIVVIGYGKTSRITSTGSVSTVSAADIRTVPTANVQNALSGKLPGFFSQQSSGQPGKDASDFFIRGKSSLNSDGNKPLIIVDDIEYTYDQLQQINVNEIETISILKDASTTAIYGIKGANGVLVVTTRRGKAGKPQVNLRSETGLQSPTRTPKFLDAYNSALLINKAQANDGLTQEFTQQDLDLFKNGNDPYGHPNVDWYNKIFSKFTSQVNTNLDISGGTDQLKYFVSGGALIQNGLLREFPDPRGQVNNGYNFNRYNFRSNLDLKANKTLSMRLDITTRFSNLNSPNESAASALSEIYDFTKQTPFTAPFLNPDGSYAYAYSRFNTAHLPTLNARIATGGYQNSRRTDYNVLFNITQNLSALTEGLSLTGRIAYASTEQFTRGTGNYGEIPSYHYDAATKTTTKNPTGDYVFPSQYYSGNTNIYTTNVNSQLFANYDRSFHKNHVTGLLLFNQTAQTFSANPFLDPKVVGVPSKFRGISIKGGYDYAGKYLIDINAAYNGTDRFAANHRFGWFPAVGVGYNISKEKFFQDALPFIGLAKIRGSYGLVGSDVAPGNKYIYAQNYLQGGGYNFGASSTPISTYYEGALPNASVVWEKQREMDIGLDLNMLKDNSLSLTVDYFHNIRYDQLITPNNIPLTLGVDLPAINLGRTRNQGFDGQIGYHSNIGNVQFGTNLVFSYARNKILFMSEASPAYPWLARTGKSIGQPFGYQSLGYYTAADVAAINAYKAEHGSNQNNKQIAVPANGEVIQPGDLKYKDLNGDGFIDIFDQTAIGNPNLPNTTLGLNLQASYKGFSISVLFQGSFNYSFIVTGTGIEPFQSQFQPIHQQAWTPENAANAQFPRLTTSGSTVNSPTFYPSNYWLINAKYVRLKTVDIGYQFPTKMLPLHLNNARIYLSAYNLFTWNNYNKYQQDPEITSNTAGDAYINQRVVNVGLQLGF